MASGKRQPSKQKRTKQNRQERAARQARATAARGAATPATSGQDRPRTSLFGRLRGQLAGGTGEPRASGDPKPGTHDGPTEPDSDALAPATEAAAHLPEPLTARPERTEPTTLLGRLRARPATATPKAPSGQAATRARPVGGRLADPTLRPPGYRAALTGVIAALAAVVASFFLHSAVDVDGDIYTKPAIVAEWSSSALAEARSAPEVDATTVAKAVDDWMPQRGSERLFLVYWPISLAAVLPIIGAALAFRAVKERRPAKVVTRAMYATLLGAFLTLGLLQFFLPTVIAVSVAGFQVRKAETRAIQQATAAGTDDA